jgi:hypothetical protein
MAPPSWSLADERRVKIGEIELAYDVSGSGPVAIQAHGMLSSRANDSALGLDFSPARS